LDMPISAMCVKMSPVTPSEPRKNRLYIVYQYVYCCLSANITSENNMTIHLPTAARDPLLLSTTWLLRAIQALLLLGAALLLLAVPFLIYFNAEVLAEIAKEEPRMSGLTSTFPLVALVTSAALACGVAFVFVRTLLSVIQTVKEGDPFITQNAARLENMGWLALAIQIIGMVVGGIAIWASALLAEDWGDFEIDISGIVLILLLFILARVFRAGAAMRDELEGTV
jgi:Protein of unknown function (DUF2975)